jgi:hypothetical protein
MPVFLTSFFGFIGSSVSSFFGFKGEQAKTVQSALEVLKSINATDAQAITASAQSISAILTQGSFLEKNWRPLFMLVLMIVVVMAWFGYIPTNFDDPVTPMMAKVWELLEIGLIGYLPCRTVEKIVQQFNIGSILKELIKKKVS